MLHHEGNCTCTPPALGQDIERSGTDRRQLAKAAVGNNTRWRCTMSKKIFVALASMAALVLSAGAGFTWS
jgi:hypothetical protein